jgi:hypothetical protein
MFEGVREGVVIGFGVLDGLGSLKGLQCVDRRRLVAVGVTLVVAFGVLSFLVAGSARAEVGHPFLGSFGSFKAALGVGVDESAGREGNVLVVDGGGPEVLEVFNGEGGRPPAGGAPQRLTGAKTPQEAFAFFAPLPAGVAVDSSQSVSKGDVYVTNVLNGVVDKFALNGADEYEYLSDLEGFALGIAVDAQGDVYLAEFGGTVSEYTPAGVLVGQFSSASVERPDGVAVDAAGDIYVQDYEAPHRLVELKRSSPTSTEVSSEATVSEGVSGVALDRATGDLFVDFGGYVEELNEGHTVISTFGRGLLEGSNGVAVAEDSEAIYVDSTGDVLRFGAGVPPTAPSIESSSATDVSGSSATLQAQIDPDWLPTAYHFEYGTSEAYGTSIPLPVGEVPAGGSGVPISVHVQGLAPGTIYHYRVSASNEIGAMTGPDHTFTTQTTGGEFVLPDDRQFELVSPAEKNGGEVRGLEGIDKGGIVQAAEAGNAATYLSFSAFEANPPAHGIVDQYLSTRGASGWTTQNISAPIRGITPPGPGLGTEYRAFSLDLSRGIDAPFERWREEGERYESRLSPEAPREFEDIYMWNQGLPGFQPLVTTAAPDTQNDEEGVPAGQAEFVGASPDLKHVVFASMRALTSNAPSGTENLYEWANGAFQLVNVLPDGQTTTAKENGLSTGLRLGALTNGANDARNAVSDDGSRVIWSYEHLDESHTFKSINIYDSNMTMGKSVQVDAPQGGSALSDGEGEEAVFQAASTDGSKVFFTSDAQLTSDANTGVPCGFGCSPPGKDLYVYDAVTGGLTDLTSDHDPADTDTCPHEFPAACGASVQGVIGASEDGTSVYFVANGTLAAGASQGDCVLGYAEQEGYAGAACNLYVAHFDGSSWTTTFIARLAGEDEADWRSRKPVLMTARVSPNGRYLAFVSQKSLTGYDNTDAVSGQPDFEVYLYEADGGRLVCVSCNPTGERPTGQEDEHEAHSSMDPEGAFGEDRPYWLSAMLPGWNGPEESGEGTIRQPRYLSDEGRLFFDSAEALVPQDTNGRVDVYEYEPDGVGSCGDEAGCIYLISEGTGDKDSLFTDASASGDDVFFISASQLVSQDTDDAYDMYDAHACTTAAPCFPVSPVSSPACTSADACRPGPTPQPPIFGAPASATFTGPGNPTGSLSTSAIKKKAVKKSRAKGRRKRGHGVKRRKRARRSRVAGSARGGVGR